MKFRLNKNFLIYYSIGFILIYIFIHVFLYDVFTIPSDSMEETIKTGDRILINKFIYGPRLPASPKEIPFFNVIFCLSKRYRLRLDSVRWNYLRPIRFSKIKSNQIIVFNYPINPNQILIKRCIALPGDTILISNKTILKNSTGFTNHLSNPKGRKTVFQDIIKPFLLQDNVLWKSRNCSQIKYESKRPISNTIDNLKPTINPEYLDYELSNPINNTIIFPNDAHFTWDLNNFGPLIIPSNGYTIQLTTCNFILYRYVINHFEDARITYFNNEFFINGEKQQFYTFKNNYYFALGDNPANSIDSRHWGFVPENLIIGKASVILFSFDSSKSKYNRFFKSIK